MMKSFFNQSISALSFRNGAPECRSHISDVMDYEHSISKDFPSLLTLFAPFKKGFGDMLMLLHKGLIIVLGSSE